MSGWTLIRRASQLRGKITPVSVAWHGLWRTMFDPYRPERHYMRGPGPRSRAKREAQVQS